MAAARVSKASASRSRASQQQQGGVSAGRSPCPSRRAQGVSKASDLPLQPVQKIWHFLSTHGLHPALGWHPGRRQQGTKCLEEQQS